MCWLWGVAVVGTLQHKTDEVWGGGEGGGGGGKGLCEMPIRSMSRR